MMLAWNSLFRLSMILGLSRPDPLLPLLPLLPIGRGGVPGKDRSIGRAAATSCEFSLSREERQ